MLRALRRAALAGSVLCALVAAPAAAQTAHPDTAGRVIPLDEAVRLALARNVGVQRSVAAEEVQRLGIASARSARLPSLSVGGGVSQSFGRSVVETQVASGTATNASASVSSDVMLYDGGATRLQVQQARLGLVAAAADRERAEQTIVYEVVNAYVNIAAQRENVARLGEQVAVAEQQLGRIAELIRERVRAEADRFTQEADVAQARLNVARARRDLAVAEAGLVGLLDLDPLAAYAFPAPALATLDSAAAAREARRLEDLVALAYDRRPDLRAREAAVRGAELAVELARTQRRPRVSASFQYGTGWSDQFRTVEVDPATGQPRAVSVSLLDQIDQRRGGSLGLGVQVPILDRGAARLAEQRALVDVAQSQLAVTELRQRLASDLATSIADLRAAPAQIGAAEAQVRAARRALEAAEERYRYSTGTAFEVVQARAQLVQAEGALLSARATFTAQRAALAYHVGLLDPERPADTAF